MPATDTIWRRLKTMHIVFLLSSVALTGSTFWMMAADHSDQWREYQRMGDAIEELKFRESENRLTSGTYLEDVESLKQTIVSAQQALDEQGAELEESRTEVQRLALEMDIVNREVGATRSERDKARADYGLAVRDGLSQETLDSLYDKFSKEQAEVDRLERELEDKQSDLEIAQEELNQKTKVYDDAQDKLSQKQLEVEQVRTARQKIAPDTWFSGMKRSVMDWYIIDGFNSPHKIIQDWLPDLHIQLGMASTARFDRCRTCHLMIDRIDASNVPAFPFGKVDSHDLAQWVEKETYPHPFATHPRPELYLTAASPHPLGEFGCTICHDGQGSATSFNNAQHGANDPHQDEVWTEEHHHHYNHFWEYPMLPKRLREASCLKCHHNVVELGVHPQFGASAPVLSRGFRLIQKYGCFGCHEIQGYNAGQAIGPDLRLEPNYNAAALQLLQLLSTGQTETTLAKDVVDLAGQIAEAPLDSDSQRHRLQSLLEADAASPSPLLDPAARSLAGLLKDAGFSGRYRKVGPALRYIAAKTTPEWVKFWTEEPKRFRPTTRMPQFFKLINQLDSDKLEAGEIDLAHVELDDLDPHARKFMPVELEGISRYLMDKSQPFELLQPVENYQPDAQRGKLAFSRRGCLACHSHKDFPEITADFGPDLSKVHAKILPGPEGFHWLYTWVRQPERYHPRTKMPNLFLEPYTKVIFETDAQGDQQQSERTIDPAADITAYLLEKGPAEFVEYKSFPSSEAALDELVQLYLTKAIGILPAEKVLQKQKYAVDPQTVKGDEIELAVRPAPRDGETSADLWRRMKLNYVGRRTISQYGCYGCHDIPGFEASRPIGTTLQDWGRKDTSKLALEHIEEYLHEHGEPNGASTYERVVDTLKRVGKPRENVEERELGAAFFVERLFHHRRAGFLWQKLRQPRSFDYKTIETKGYDERLRMPKFPFTESDIEAIATFILGLVAEPPAERYVYTPQGPAKDRIEGEFLLEKYNCLGCHMVELPQAGYALEVPDSGSPFADLIGMTADEIAGWFVEHRTQLIADTFNPDDYPADVKLMQSLGAPLEEIVRLTAGDGVADGDQDGLEELEGNVRGWLAEHPQYMLTTRLDPAQGEFPAGIEQLLRLKPPVHGTIDQTGDEEKPPIVRFHGLLMSPPDPEEDPEFQLYGYQLWETLEVGGRIIRPGSNMAFTTLQAKLELIKPARGGRFAEWLVENLQADRDNKASGDRGMAWQMSPPSLYLEGSKVQTPWLYKFLKNPQRIRHETVLRMPRFNLDDAEARTLANYFAAVDGVPYPYQDIPQREPAYRADLNNELQRENLVPSDSNYLSESWKLLNAKICIGCHDVGGKPFIAPDPNKVTHGPDLNRVYERLRPEWLTLWLSKPAWITPYTKMIPPKADATLFGGEQNAPLQSQALRDALLNYNDLMQRDGAIFYDNVTRTVKPPEAAESAPTTNPQ